MLTKTSRVQSIDIVRGLVMVIMALDHVRDYFYNPAAGAASDLAMSPTDLTSTTPMLFFTRWITHLCAPTFVMLTGASVYLQGMRKSKKELSLFLLKRGIFLILLEAIVITLAWTFNPLYNLIILQVIWAIGISMIILSAIIFLPFPAIVAIGFAIVLGHNILDFFPSKTNTSVIADAVYYSQFSIHPLAPDHFVLFVYSFLPWTGLMMVGYGVGKWFTSSVSAGQRKKLLLTTGLVLIAAFIVIRWINIYGDPSPWAVQPRGAVFTFLSFMNGTKYPASLIYFCMTLGPAFLLLALFEKWKSGLNAILNVYGRVPLFYYIMHMYLIHFIVVIMFFQQGFGTKDIVTPNNPFLFKPPAFGVNLVGVYILWILVVVLLYPICAWYNRYKSTHTQWWLKYL